MMDLEVRTGGSKGAGIFRPATLYVVQNNLIFICYSTKGCSFYIGEFCIQMCLFFRVIAFGQEALTHCLQAGKQEWSFSSYSIVRQTITQSDAQYFFQGEF